jgi:predicted Zn-dependent protease
MRTFHRLTRIVLLSLLASAVFPAINVLAQEVGNQRVIKDPKLAACLNHLGQHMVQSGVAKVPFAIKLEVAGDSVPDQPREVVRDPVIAACITLLAQNLVRNGNARVPIVMRVRTAR